MTQRSVPPPPTPPPLRMIRDGGCMLLLGLLTVLQLTLLGLIA